MERLFKFYLAAIMGIMSIAMCTGLNEYSAKNNKKLVLSMSIQEESLYNYIDEFISETSSNETKTATRNILLNLDTNKFILKIYSSDGDKIYDGKYVGRPKEFVMPKGNYNVDLLSSNFTGPQFDSPLIGDQKTVIVGDEDNISIQFSCRQLNCGLKLSFDADFKSKFPGTCVVISQNSKSENYRFTDNRYIYLNASLFEIHSWTNGTDTTLIERSLAAGQMLSLKLSYAQKGKGASFSYACDTSRQWISGNINVGFSLPPDCITIQEANTMIDCKNVKVFGYIFGGDATYNTIRIAPPFASKTSLVIAPSMKERLRANCMSVELPIGQIRDELNLVDNPEMIGSPVVIYGNIVESYFGYPGIKSTKKYSLL